MKKYRGYVLAVLAAAVIFGGSRGTAKAADLNGTLVATAQSADNSLKKLAISDAELSPDFYYSTTKYTATVPYDVTDVEVTAEVSNSRASIVSISGNENLAVGENTITVVVAAENGSQATYTVTLTREEAEEQGEDAGAETVDDGENTVEPDADAGGTPDGEEDTIKQNTDTVETTDDGQDVAQDTETVEDVANSESDSVDKEQYEQLLANYNAASANAKQYEQKIRIMTAVFLFVIAILLIIMFIILLASRKNDDYDEGDVFEEEKPKKPEKQKKSEISLELAVQHPAEPVTVENIPEIQEIKENIPAVEEVKEQPVEEPVEASTIEKTEISEKTNISAEPDIPSEPDVSEEPDASEKPDVSEEPEKTGKFKRAILAYLGIGDAFSGEESDELEPSAEQPSEEEPEPFFDGAWDKTEDTAADSVAEKSGSGFFGSKKKKSEDSEDDDIEFIDL